MFPCIDSYKPAAETKPVYAVPLARVLVNIIAITFKEERC